jgi:hypothetical protein
MNSMQVRKTSKNAAVTCFKILSYDSFAENLLNFTLDTGWLSSDLNQAHPITPFGMI